MARLQQPASLLPAESSTGGQNHRHDTFRDNNLSARKILIGFCAGLASVLSPGLAYSDVVTPVLTDGTYRSSEQLTHSPAELGLSLSVPPLPDPASIFLQTQISPKTALKHVQWENDIAWITGIGTLLYNDSDNDGYHSGFSLTIDADTSLNITDVFVSIDLQSYSGLRERLHTSRNFSLYGRSLTDEYQIDIDLLQNYPADEYDIVIELHDAFDYRVLDRVSASNFSNLSALPLESEDMDYVYNPRPVQPPFPPANDDIYVEEYAGSAGLLTTLCLSLALWARRKRSPGR